MTLWGHSKKTAIFKPRREASEEMISTDTLILDFQNWDKINWSTQSAVLHHGSPSRLMYYVECRAFFPLWHLQRVESLGWGLHGGESRWYLLAGFLQKVFADPCCRQSFQGPMTGTLQRQDWNPSWPRWSLCPASQSCRLFSARNATSEGAKSAWFFSLPQFILCPVGSCCGEMPSHK